MILCKSCKNIIDNKYYKCLWINSHKTKLVICNECHMNFYITKPYLFKKDHPQEYERVYDKIKNIVKL